MKRCPKCEFIYEDDQSLCDMDGVLLVLDSRNLPNLHALQTVPAKTPPKRNRAVPAFATVILALVLGLVYYVSIHRRATQNSYTPEPPTAATTSNPAPEVNPTPESQPATEEPKPEPPKPEPVAAAVVPAKRATAKPVLTPTKAKVEEKKDDSKVGNILKKTGRLLKKPFKF
jgi:cytoskeletal protein RodZ